MLGSFLIFIGTLLGILTAIIFAEDKLKQNPGIGKMICSARASFNEIIKWLVNQSSMSILTELSKYFAAASVIMLAIVGVVQRFTYPIPPVLALVFIFFLSCTVALGWFLLLRTAWPVVFTLIVIITALPLFPGDHNLFLSYQVNDLCYSLGETSISCSFLSGFPKELQISIILFVSLAVIVLSASILSAGLVLFITFAVIIVLETATFLEENFTTSSFDGLMGLMLIVSPVLVGIGTWLS
jgi:hypothetical protein